MVFNVNDNGEIEDFEVDWLGKKVYVSMEEAEIYDKELEKQMSLILDNVEEWDVKIKNSIVKKYLGMANSRLKENKLSVPHWRRLFKNWEIA